MPRVIKNFPIKVGTELRLDLPVEAQPLGVRKHGGEFILRIQVEANPKSKVARRSFYLAEGKIYCSRVIDGQDYFLLEDRKRIEPLEQEAETAVEAGGEKADS